MVLHLVVMVGRGVAWRLREMVAGEGETIHSAMARHLQGMAFAGLVSSRDGAGIILQGAGGTWHLCSKITAVGAGKILRAKVLVRNGLHVLVCLGACQMLHSKGCAIARAIEK